MKGEVSGERPKIPSPPTKSKPSLKRLAENSRKAAGEINKISQSPTPKIAISVQDLSRTIRSKKDPIIKEIKVAADTAKKPKDVLAKKPEKSTSETPETSTSAGSTTPTTPESPPPPPKSQTMSLKKSG